ncbi:MULTISPECIES: hypothetical protein [Breznakia]|uniref:Uncharacterized protein n=1 Tax=Breznakia blatticola TaxID=1754012 RepID=A0A4R8A7F1_9FIRM|nr:MULTISPECIES: hypothetical protein [Breznakia]MDH6366318.1 hypothetical protein [Breznakia sp. PH1-1]MDH6403411.1 hypothetical protein [Breznakia sp. PF1-11]MDH6411120.1 hypothetical protein [Breznakia sp. PFB1-11]MDH6413617.1 hypothetical protein [Breznakia sp. PFB1-14]MDH6415665.1 hypothetical protein [Breznakia sp. PFB1-4]
MSIFDKIKDVLFTEETDVEETLIRDEDEGEFIEEEKEVKVQKPKPKPLPKPKPRYEDVEAITEDIERIREPESKLENIFDIKADEVKKEEPSITKRLQPKIAKDFEIPQVISPITGVTTEKIDEEAEFVASKPRRTKDSLGTVISPFYGEVELEEFHQQAQVELAVNQMQSDDVEEEEIENISLDQIVASPYEQEEEMVQFSLFGDDAPIRDLQEEEQEQTQEDTEDNEDLPF